MSLTLATPALVLHTTQYAETSIIAKIFTRQLGVRSYILKGVRRCGGRTKQNLLQPLSHLDLVVYDNPKAKINYLKEVSPHAGAPVPAPGNAACGAVCNALRFFMTELLYKTLREEEPMPELFDYVVSSARFGEGDSDLSHRPILFLLTVARHMGIEPLDNYSRQEPLFDMQDGRYCHGGDCTLDSDLSLLLHHYLQAANEGAALPAVPLRQRTELIDRMLDYFQRHLATFRDFKSHEILHTILH